MKILMGWAIAVVAGLVLLSACGGGDGEGMPPPAGNRYHCPTHCEGHTATLYYRQREPK